MYESNSEANSTPDNSQNGVPTSKEPQSPDVMRIASLPHLRKKQKKVKVDRKKLEKIVQGRVLFQEPLARYTTMRVGGPADALVFPANLSDLLNILQFADQNHLPVFILGGGANLLVRDGGIRGLTVCLRETFKETYEVKPEDLEDWHLEGFSENHKYFRVGSGFSIPRLVRAMTNQGLSGLEGLAGVVGSIGGALAMNAGTKNGEIGDRVFAIRSINKHGQIKVFKKKDLKFSYRHLDLDRSWYHMEVILELEQQDPQSVNQRMKEYLDYRQETQPLNWPNSGSIFKNPKGESAGELLERHGLKGVRVRGAKFSELHANWIVNLGDATAQDIFRLIDLAKDKIKEKRTDSFRDRN